MTSELLLMGFPIEVVGGGEPVPIIMGASFARGTYDHESTVTLLHYPAENTDDTLFTFRITEDMNGIDVLREELTVSVRRLVRGP